MAKTNSEPASAAGPQTIEQLQKRYRELHEKKIKAETQRDDATGRLNQLKEQARTKYGTDDVAELTKKLDEIIRENEQKRTTYQEDLDKIEKGLAEVEDKFSDKPPAPARGGSTQ
jgi:uncharacterized coiled-coil DUF342 family protein